MELTDLTRDLEGLRDEARASIAAAGDVATLEAIELDVLGRKGRLTLCFVGSARCRRRIGPRSGRSRTRSAARSRRRSPSAAATSAERAPARLATEAVDVTTPGRPIRRGSLHPIVETVREIAAIFGQFGFVTYEGPEVEDDLTNFQMLNIPRDHPARDLWDTLYVDVEDHLLRTHTSPGQIRVMTSSRRRSGRCSRAAATATRRSTRATPRSSSRSRA